MTRRPSIPRSLPLFVVAALILVGCDRSPAPGADSVQTMGSTVRPTSATVAASTPLPVSPAGLTNSSTAGTGNDLSNSTRASGSSNVYQPPTSDNPAPGPTMAGSGSPASAASQSTSSQTRGTSPPPNDGTLPRGTEGSNGSRAGGGKS